MTTFARTTLTAFAEQPRRYSHSPISRHFSCFLGAMAAHVESERDIETVDSFDPAVMAWHRDAEVARGNVIGLINAIQDAEIARIEDVPLKRMAMLTLVMIESDNTFGFQRSFSFLETHSDYFACPGTSAVARRVQQMLRTARDRLQDLHDLTTYVDPLEIPEDADDSIVLTN